VISHEPFSGLPILNGFDSRVIADRLQDAFPNARILIVIREQRSMMLSVYKHYVKFSGTKPVDYVWHEYTPRDRRYPTPGLEVFEYHRLVEYYMKHFGAENVLVLPYEQLVRDAVDFTGRICRFVGVDAPSSVPVSRRNVSPPGMLIAMLRYANVLIQAFGLAASPWGGPIRHPKVRRARMNAIRRVSGWIPKRVSKPFDRKIAEAVNAVPAPGFAASNARTSELIGVDLRAFGYEMPA
jgi:hypothetical protein